MRVGLKQLRVSVIRNVSFGSEAVVHLGLQLARRGRLGVEFARVRLVSGNVFMHQYFQTPQVHRQPLYLNI